MSGGCRHHRDDWRDWGRDWWYRCGGNGCGQGNRCWYNERRSNRCRCWHNRCWCRGNRRRSNRCRHRHNRRWCGDNRCWHNGCGRRGNWRSHWNWRRGGRPWSRCGRLPGKPRLGSDWWRYWRWGCWRLGWPGRGCAPRVRLIAHVRRSSSHFEMANTARVGCS